MIPLELPTEDVATLVSPLPLRSRHGALQLSMHGLRFVDRGGAEVLRIDAGAIASLDAQGNADLRVRYQEDGRTRQVRLRVRWARITDRTTVMPHPSRVRPWLWGARSDSGHRSARAKSLVRDRWESALTTLISSDRYALRRR